MRILCDLDAMACDLLTDWLALYNAKYDDKLTVDKITAWDIHQFTKPECGLKVYDLLKEPGVFANLKPLPGAVQGIKALQEAGHDVTILTAGAASDFCASEKLAWCKQHLGLNRKKVIIGHPKQFVKGDLLLDDSPDNISVYRKEWPQAEIFAIAYPYNRVVADKCRRFYGWQDTAVAWDMMVRAVETEVERRKWAGWAA